MKPKKMNPRHIRYALYLRKSFRYALGHDTLDRWVSVGTTSYRYLNGVTRYKDRESATCSMIVRVYGRAAKRDIIAALEDAHRYSCQCEHDCCGHWFCHFVEVKRIDRRHYLVIQHLNANV